MQVVILLTDASPSKDRGPGAPLPPEFVDEMPFALTLSLNDDASEPTGFNPRRTSRIEAPPQLITSRLTGRSHSEMRPAAMRTHAGQSDIEKSPPLALGPRRLLTFRLRFQGEQMSVWLLIGIVTLIASVFAAVAPRIDVHSSTNLAWLAHDFGPGDSESQETARRTASRVVLPIAALAAVVTLTGLVASGGASWSGITSLVGLLLVGISFLAGALAGRRSIRRGRDRTNAR